MKHFITPSGMVSWKNMRQPQRGPETLTSALSIVFHIYCCITKSTWRMDLTLLQQISWGLYSHWGHLMLNFVIYYTSEIWFMDLCSQDEITTTFNKCAIILETDSQVYEKVYQETGSLCQISYTDKASICLVFSRTVLTLNTLLDNILMNPSTVLEMPIFYQIVTELSQ